jgi:hypothetical protein
MASTSPSPHSPSAPETFTNAQLGWLAACVQRGVAILAERQLPDGEFATFIARDPEYREEVRFDSSVFATTFVLHATAFLRHPALGPMRARAVDFLAGQMEARGAWSYWTSRNRRRIRADLDDTACASVALRAAGRTFPDNRPLFLANRNAEGLFLTWVQEPGPEQQATWREVQPLNPLQMAEVCCVVQANVVHYLGEQPATERAIAFLNEVAVQDRAGQHDVYYLQPMAFPYALSRAFQGGAGALGASRGPLLERLLAAQQPDGTFGNPLATALAACTLLNFGARDRPLQRAVAALAEQQDAAGSWPRVPFYVGPHCGSEDLTTALCLEAIGRAIAPR